MTYPMILVEAAERRKSSPQQLYNTLRSTIFPNGERATNEQVLALLFVAEQYGLDPWRKEIYAFPAKGGGIMPVMGYDGWLKIANNSEHFDGMEIAYVDAEADTYCEVTIHRKDRQYSPPIQEWLSECRRSTDPWKTMPKRMLRNRAVCQAIRLSFGVGGIMLPDEAEGALEPRNVRAEPVTKTAQMLEAADAPTEETTAVPESTEAEHAAAFAEPRVLTDEEADKIDAELFGNESQECD